MLTIVMVWIIVDVAAALVILYDYWCWYRFNDPDRLSTIELDDEQAKSDSLSA